MVGGGMVMVTWESREDLRGCREDAPQGLGVAGPGEGALASLPWRPWILGFLFWRLVSGCRSGCGCG